MKDFVDISFSTNNLDTYYTRYSILKALNETSQLFSGKILDIGCGKMPYKKHLFDSSDIKEYIGLDIESALTYDADIKPDFTWNGLVMPFNNESFNCAFGTEVLEHCPNPELVLKEVYRVLENKGVFFFTVPFLWNLHETPNDEYRYTPFSLRRHLENSGFKDIDIKATGGWHASMAQMLGLWVRRSPIGATKQKYLSIILKPVIKYLLKKDSTHNIVFKDGQMITGLYGIAKK